MIDKTLVNLSCICRHCRKRIFIYQDKMVKKCICRSCGRCTWLDWSDVTRIFTNGGDKAAKRYFNRGDQSDEAY